MFTEPLAKMYEACAKLTPKFRIEHEIVQVNHHLFPPMFPVIASYAGDQPLGKVGATCVCGDNRCLEVALSALLQGSLQLLRRSN
jgi:hypothetical protein